MELLSSSCLRREVISMRARIYWEGEGIPISQFPLPYLLKLELQEETSHHHVTRLSNPYNEFGPRHVEHKLILLGKEDVAYQQKG
jgi:hypothetical protein